MRKKLFQAFLQNKALTLLVFLGSLSWALTMVKSGLVYSFGMGFWGPNGHDGVWHLALIESLAKGSRAMPVFAGEVIKNYHIGFDLILATLYRLTGVSPVNLYFQIIPPLLALSIGILTYKFVYGWTNSKKSAFWSTFFVYFGGSFGWVLTLVREGNLGGESAFWSQQAISTLVNPPFALSLVLILSGLIFLLKLKKRFKIHQLALAIFFFGVLIQVKVYASILVLCGLGVALVWSMFLKKESSESIAKRALLALFLAAFGLTVVLLIPLGKVDRDLLVFQPFWFLETMMGLTDRLGWLKFHSAMTTYRSGNIWTKAIPAYFIAFLIFWFGNLGTRVVKEVLILKWIKNAKRIGWIEVFFSAVILTGVIIPVLFLQKGTPWNTIQFMYYSLIFSGILAGVGLGEWLENPRVSIEIHPRGGLSSHRGGLSSHIRKKKILVAVIVVLTIPTTIGTLEHYLPARPPAMISKGELEALSFLSKQPDGVVLTYPFDREAARLAESTPPRPLYLYESTAYVAAFSGKPVYLEDEVNLDITGYDWRARRKKVEVFFNTLDEKQARQFLTESNIKYLYLVLSQSPIIGQQARLGETQLGINQVFDNDQVKIYATR